MFDFRPAVIVAKHDIGALDKERKKKKDYQEYKGHTHCFRVEK